MTEPAYPELEPLPSMLQRPNGLAHRGEASDRTHSLQGLELSERGTLAVAAPQRGVFLDSNRADPANPWRGVSPCTHTTAADTNIRKTGCSQEPKCTEKIGRNTQQESAPSQCI